MTIFGNPQCNTCGMTYNIVEGRRCSCADKPVRLIRQKTLCDEFAMAALTGLLTNTPEYRPHHQATKAYEYADAMLKAREEV